MARREAQTYGFRDPFGIAAGASRRATYDGSGAGPRFSLLCALPASGLLERYVRSGLWPASTESKSQPAPGRGS